MSDKQRAMEVIYKPKRSATVMPTHTCFDDVIDILGVMRAEGRSRFEARIVHAVCVGDCGSEFAHAWVEDLTHQTVRVLGLVDGRRVELCYTDKALYYNALRIQEALHYTVDEFLENMQREDHSGPWDPYYKSLCGIDRARVMISHRPVSGVSYRYI